MTEFDLSKNPREKFCSLPTPIQRLDRFSKEIGNVNIYMKRDDLTGIAFGGNKNRKLEYLLADALKKKADVIITEGAVTSNHCLQTAACAAKIGIACHLVLSDAVTGEKITGNLLLNQILDATIHRVNATKDRKDKMKKIAENVKKDGKKAYIIPTGGSNEIGILGYVNFMKEISQQAKTMGVNFDKLVFASGSGGTQAGMLIGKHLFYPHIDILGITVGDYIEDLENSIQEIIQAFSEKNNVSITIAKEEIKILAGYAGEGYGVTNEELVKTIKLVAKKEGIFLDPVYNGKAMIGLIDLIQKEEINKEMNVLFLHSGGGPALFVYDHLFGKPLTKKKHW